MSKMRVGIIGTGDIARPYITHLVNYPDDIEVVGVVDLNQERAKEFAEKYDIVMLLRSHKSLAKSGKIVLRRQKLFPLPYTISPQ